MHKKPNCPDCGGSTILQDNISGEQVCQTCGIVLSSTNIDTGPEWRAFDAVQRDKLTRTGAPATWMIHDKGLSTSIGWRDRDSSGRLLDPEMRARLYRLRKWQQRSKISDSMDRNLSHALNKMRSLQSKLSLPGNVVETASLLYRRALNNNLVRGRTVDGVVAACIYMACRQCGVIRSLEEVGQVFGYSKKDVARSYRFLFRSLKPSVPKVETESYISRIVVKLGLLSEVEFVANMILEQASLMRLTGGRGPAGLAAACVYISIRVVGEHRTQGDIAKIAQVTEVTVRNRYKELVEQLDIIIKV